MQSKSILYFLWNVYNKRVIHSQGKEEKNIMLFSLKERGQGMVEYALILVLVAVVVIAALTIMGPLVKNIFNTINASL
jgi:pilus assembly protein Flp/PilA